MRIKMTVLAALGVFAVSEASAQVPGHIWAQYWNEGAVYSPDGMTIQFDRGSVWQRIIPEPIVRRRY